MPDIGGQSFVWIFKISDVLEIFWEKKEKGRECGSLAGQKSIRCGYKVICCGKILCARGNEEGFRASLKSFFVL